MNSAIRLKYYNELFKIVGKMILTKTKVQEEFDVFNNLTYDKYLNLPDTKKELINTYLEKLIKYPRDKNFSDKLKKVSDEKINNLEFFLKIGEELKEEKEQNKEIRQEKILKAKENIQSKQQIIVKKVKEIDTKEMLKKGKEIRKVTFKQLLNLGKSLKIFKNKRTLKTISSMLLRTGICVLVLIFAPSLLKMIQTYAHISNLSKWVNIGLVIYSGITVGLDISDITDIISTFIEIKNIYRNNKEEITSEESELEDEKQELNKENQMEIIYEDDYEDIENLVYNPYFKELKDKLEKSIELQNNLTETYRILEEKIENMLQESGKGHKDLYVKGNEYVIYFNQKNFIKRLIKSSNDNVIGYSKIVMMVLKYLEEEPSKLDLLFKQEGFLELIQNLDTEYLNINSEYSKFEIDIQKNSVKG